MKINAVVSLPDNEQAEVIAGEMPCYYENCFSNSVYRVESPCKWTRHLLKEFKTTGTCTLHYCIYSFQDFDTLQFAPDFPDHK